MSLSALRTMRLERKKPAFPLSVVVGKVGPLAKTDPSVIEVAVGSMPSLMDWRPVVGLWVNFYFLTFDEKTMGLAIHEVVEAKGKPLAICGDNFTAPLATAQGRDIYRLAVIMPWMRADLCN